MCSFCARGNERSFYYLLEKGKKVQDAKEGEIAKGTAIATFDENDKYPTDSKGRHAAIYLRHNHEYIVVYDQWNKQAKVKKRKIKFNVKDGESRSNDGKTFYVIEAITQWGLSKSANK